MKKAIFWVTVALGFFAYKVIIPMVTVGIPEDKGIAVLLIAICVFLATCVYLPRKIIDKLLIKKEKTDTHGW